MPTELPSLQIQAILFHNDRPSIEKALDSIDQAVRLAARAGVLGRTSVQYGDGSPSPLLTPEVLEGWRKQFDAIDEIGYDFFGDNLGSAAGHNRLASRGQSTFIATSNPDVIPSPRSIQTMLQTFDDPTVGLVEAKQLPIEHPKDYDAATGATSWSATAFAMFPRSVFDQLEGFDANTFFLYCDDVDFSWRIRLAGLKVIMQPAATVFHDKRLSLNGVWLTTSAERYYSAEAALLLAHKWSRSDLATQYLDYFETQGSDEMIRAASEFRRRVSEGLLAEQVDSNNKIAEFVDGFYAKHRYSL